jgi:hypothetical protein
MGTRELFFAKGVVSVSMVLFQAVVLMTAVGAMQQQPADHPDGPFAGRAAGDRDRLS